MKDWHEQARERVDGTPDLKTHEATIFYDWPNWEEHMEWVATAPVEEIVDWAEQIENADEAQEDK